MIRHIVMWKFRSGTETEQERFLEGLRSLQGVIPQLRRSEVARSVGTDNYDAVLVSEFDTLDAYKADVRAKLEAQAAERDNNAFANAVIEKVMANATVEIPDAMVERQIDSMVRNFEARLAQQGLKLADFMKYTGQDEKSFRNQYRDQAEKSVRANLVLEAVENVEKFEAAEEEIDAEIEKFAKQIGQNVEELKKNLTEGDREYFKADVIRDKAVKFLCDNAKAE
mgnify:CR=1 FL=1